MYWHEEQPFPRLQPQQHGSASRLASHLSVGKIEIQSVVLYPWPPSYPSPVASRSPGLSCHTPVAAGQGSSE